MSEKFEKMSGKSGKYQEIRKSEFRVASPAGKRIANKILGSNPRARTFS